MGGIDAVPEPITTRPPAGALPFGEHAFVKADPQFKRLVGQRAFEIRREGPFRVPGDALAFVEATLPAAEKGDALSTYAIYLAVLDCRLAGSPDELMNLDAMQAGSLEASALLSMDQRLEECQGLLSDEQLVSRDWLGMAAEQGSVEAMLMYAADSEAALGRREDLIRSPERIVEWKRRAMGFLETARSAGSVDAILALAGAYDNGVLVARDPFQAYAHYLAAQRISADYAPAELLADSETALSAEQRAAARTRARLIYAACCSASGESL